MTSDTHGDVLVRPVTSRRDMREFLEVPLRLHLDDPLWMPLPKLIEKMQLDTGHDPFWRHAERELFIAECLGTVVGRIVAVCDHALDKQEGVKVGGWGFLACENSLEVFRALFEAVENWHQEHNSGETAFLRGPLNPSLNYSAGMLVVGFDQEPPFLSPWNPSYYPELTEACGMEKEQDILYYRFTREAELEARKNFHPEVVEQFAAYTFRRSRATPEDMALFAELFNACWSENWGYSPLTAAEISDSTLPLRMYPGLMYLNFLEHQGQTVGVTMLGADLTRLVRSLRGRISLAWPWRIVSGLRHIEGFRGFFGGVLKEHRFGAIPWLTLREWLAVFDARPNTRYLDVGWVLEDNDDMNVLMENFGGTVITRSRIYRKNIVHAW